MCGRLNYSMYGTRDAAANWSDECTQRLIDMGLKAGRAIPCVFYHQQRGLRAHMHRDDFVVVRKMKNVDWLDGEGNDYAQEAVK